jgi:hypothetical protein
VLGLALTTPPLVLARARKNVLAGWSPNRKLARNGLRVHAAQYAGDLLEGDFEGT